jgi:hypothetical protein
MLRLTLDTNCVIHAAQAQPYGPQVDELVDLARDGRVDLWITEAFSVDQERAPTDKHQRNLAWLGQRPPIGRISGPFRLGYSALGGPMYSPTATPPPSMPCCARSFSLTDSKPSA